MTKPSPFILLSTQRSGSSWVQEMLGSHPDLKVYSEMFLPDSHGIPMWEPSDVEFASSYVQARARRPVRVGRHYWTVRYVQRLLRQPGECAVGFKYMYDQIPHSLEVLPYAALRRVRVVHLVRRNLLDIVISARRAEASGVYHVPADGRPAVPWLGESRHDVRIRLEPRELIADLRRLERSRRLARAWLRWSQTASIEVAYEDLVDASSAFVPVLEFLGVSSGGATRLSSALRKITTGPRAEVVANYDEVQVALSGGPFAHLIATS